jgi:glycosyltransferase involved in cell wall biosynthesis
MENVYLSIVLPCYNPLPDWAPTIITAMQELKQRLPQVVFQLIIVNDGSSKAIPAADVAAIDAAVEDFEYIHYTENRGKGYALRQGIQAVRYDYCIYTDIDFPYTTDSFVALFERLQAPELDVVAGVRDAHYYQHVPPFRKFISKVLRFFIKLLLRIQITDTQCGIKGFNAAGRAVFLQTEIDRYLFDLEFIFLVSNNKHLNISSIPVALKPEIVFSKVNLKVLLTESRSFVKLFFRSFFSQKAFQPSTKK